MLKYIGAANSHSEEGRMQNEAEHRTKQNTADPQ